MQSRTSAPALVAGAVLAPVGLVLSIILFGGGSQAAAAGPAAATPGPPSAASRREDLMPGTVKRDGCILLLDRRATGRRGGVG